MENNNLKDMASIIYYDVVKADIHFFLNHLNYFINKSDYDKYKDEFDLDKQTFLIEYSRVNKFESSNMYAIPLKDGRYYIKAEYFAPLDNGKIINKEELIKLLYKVKESYDKEGFIYYYESYCKKGGR